MLTARGTGLRYLVLDHQLPYRADAEAQVSRLHHPLYGRGGQGDLGDEAVCKLLELWLGKMVVVLTVGSSTQELVSSRKLSSHHSTKCAPYVTISRWAGDFGGGKWKWHYCRQRIAGDFVATATLAARTRALQTRSRRLCNAHGRKKLSS
jgi:hypothetical protein